MGPEYFEDQLHDKTGILAATEGVEDGSPAMEHVLNTRAAAAAGHPAVSTMAETRPKISPSEALRQKHTHLAGIQLMASQFGGKIVDMSNDAVIVEISGKTTRVSSFFLQISFSCVSFLSFPFVSLVQVKSTTDHSTDEMI